MRRGISLSADVVGRPDELILKCLTDAWMGYGCKRGFRRVLKEEKLAEVELVPCEVGGNDRRTNPISSLHRDNETSAYARNNAEAELLEVTGPAMEASSFFPRVSKKPGSFFSRRSIYHIGMLKSLVAHSRRTARCFTSTSDTSIFNN
jgi:hypothetical protein